jgi:hypothetical protein
MENEHEVPEIIEHLIAIRARRLNILAHGVSLGAVLAIIVFTATNWLILKGGEEVGPHLSLLGQYFIGYRVTMFGSIIGAAYGMLVGGLMGSLFAWVYNYVADQREKLRK